MAKMSEKNPKDLDSIEKFLRDADIASTLVDGFQSQKPDSIVPAMLAWMYFGNSWETVVSYNEEMIQDKDTGLSDRIKEHSQRTPHKRRLAGVPKNSEIYGKHCAGYRHSH